MCLGTLSDFRASRADSFPNPSYANLSASENIARLKIYFRRSIVSIRGKILRQMERAGLTDESLQMLGDPAVFSFIAPLAASELLVMCLLAQFQELVEGTMIGVYRRFPAHVTCTGHDAQISARTAGGGQVGLR